MLLSSGWLKMFGRYLILSYIDAGTGSLIIQILIGSFAGGVLALKLTWSKLKNWVKPNHIVKEQLNEGQENLIGQ